jgi:hypothetical protein
VRGMRWGEVGDDRHEVRWRLGGTGYAKGE